MHRPAGDSEAGSAAAGALLSQGCGRKEEGKPPVRGGVSASGASAQA